MLGQAAWAFVLLVDAAQLCPVEVVQFVLLQQCMGKCVSPHLCQFNALLDSLTFANLIGKTNISLLN